MPQTMSQPCGANYALPAVRIPPISVFEHTMWILNDAVAGWPGTVREGRSHTRDTCLSALNPFAAKSFADRLVTSPRMSCVRGNA